MTSLSHYYDLLTFVSSRKFSGDPLEAQEHQKIFSKKRKSRKLVSRNNELLTSLSRYNEITRKFSRKNESQYVVITRSPENLFIHVPNGAPYLSV